MLRIVSLLNSKNHYLEQFYSLNESELLNFAKYDFSNIEYFYQTRENILEAIRYVDGEITAAQNESCVVSDSHKREVTAALAIKDEYVNRILAQDLEVLACIESAKSTIIRELQDLRGTRQAVGAYKSRSFQNRLDEEA